MPNILPLNPPASAPPEYGIADNPLFVQRLYLDNARDLQELEIAGSMLWVAKASSKSAWIDLRLNDQLRGPLTFKEGLFISGTRFSRVYVTHDAQAGAWMDIVYAVEGNKGIRIENPASQYSGIALSANQSISAYGAVSVGVAATLIQAANTDRKSIAITPVTADIYIGSNSSVTTANGLLVPARSTIIITNISAIYGIAAAATDTRYLEEE